MTLVLRTRHDILVEKGRWRAYRWLLLRRLSQLVILVLFLLGPLSGIWIVKGSLTSSLTLEILPLTDPYVLLQSVLAGHLVSMTAIIGAALVIAFYLIVGGKTYCAWVCPVNIITDAAAWLRDRWQIKGGIQFSRSARYGVLIMTLILAILTGVIIWELVNPVSLLYRSIIFGMGLTWVLMIAIFLFDLFLSRRGWCGHLCPVGAFYSLLGSVRLIHVTASQRERCDDCLSCFTVCPEPQIIRSAVKGAKDNISPVIASSHCTHCGRCIDICTQEVFQFSTRFNRDINTVLVNNEEINK